MSSARKTSGLTDQDSFDARVFLRSLNDAMYCAQEIAQREVGVAHYKEYMRAIIKATKYSQLFLIDKDGEVCYSATA